MVLLFNQTIFHIRVASSVCRIGTQMWYEPIAQSSYHERCGSMQHRTGAMDRVLDHVCVRA